MQKENLKQKYAIKSKPAEWNREKKERNKNHDEIHTQKTRRKRS